jgi:hypothetical protein
MFGPRLDLPSTNETTAQSEKHQNSVQRPRSGNKDFCSMVCFTPGPFTVFRSLASTTLAEEYEAESSRD